MTSPTAIPSGWERGNIRRFAQMKSGHTPSRSVPKYWENTDIPWFTLADVWQLRDGKQTYLGETASTINELGLANSAAELLPSGTVVLSRTASVGFSGIMPKPMATSQDFWNWVCGPQLLPEYLNYQFKTMVAEFKSLNMGSTHQTIYQKDAAALQIVVPPLAEQRAIVDYLDRESARIDTLIEEQQRLIELVRERRQALIKRSMADSSDTPIRLSRVASSRSGDVPPPLEPDGRHVVWGAGRVVGHTSQVNAQAGDLLVGRVGQGSVGKVRRLTEDAWATDNTIILRLNLSAADPRYIEHGLRLIPRFELVGGGAMPLVTAERLLAQSVPFTTLTTQRKVADYLDQQTAKIDNLISETERFIDLSKERKAALIAAAVTGKIDVREMA